MNDGQDIEFTDEESSSRGLIAEAKAHRLLVTNSNGKEFANVSVFIAVIVALLAPQVAMVMAVIAIYKGASVEIVRAHTKEDSQDKKKKNVGYSSHQLEDYFEQEHDLKNELKREE